MRKRSGIEARKGARWIGRKRKKDWWWTENPEESFSEEERKRRKGGHLLVDKHLACFWCCWTTQENSEPNECKKANIIIIIMHCTGEERNANLVGLGFSDPKELLYHWIFFFFFF